MVFHHSLQRSLRGLVLIFVGLIGTSLKIPYISHESHGCACPCLPASPCWACGSVNVCVSHVLHALLGYVTDETLKGASWVEKRDSTRRGGVGCTQGKVGQETQV